MVDPQLNFIDKKSTLWAIAFLSLGIKLSLMLSGMLINNDGVLYISIARLFEMGKFSEGVKLYPMPAYPFLIYLVHSVIPDWVGAARFISTISYVLAVVPLYKFTELVFNRKAAFWAALLFAVSPFPNTHALDVIRDPVYLLIFSTYLWGLMESLERRNFRFMILSACCAGMAILFRIEGIVLFTTPILFFFGSYCLSSDKLLKSFSGITLLIWFFFPVLAGILLIIVMQQTSLSGINRFGEMGNYLSSLLDLSAFENYLTIYDHFKSTQNSLPFSGFNSSIVAVTRHWMPLIYLIGLIETLVKVIFPIFLIPLFLTVRKLFKQQLQLTVEVSFIMFSFVVYFLFIYYSYITRDLLVSRFLFPMVFLLYGFMGQGICILIKTRFAKTFPRLLFVSILLLFIVAPIGRGASKTFKSDTTIRTVGHWIAHNDELKSMSIITSEPLILFYADRIDDYQHVNLTTLNLMQFWRDGDIPSIETYAMKENADAFVVRVKNDQEKQASQFSIYQPIKSFSDKKGRLVIFAR